MKRILYFGLKLKLTICAAVLLFCASAKADTVWNFSGGDTQGWWGAQGVWEGSQFDPQGKTLKNFSTMKDALVENGKLVSPSYYLASPVGFGEWGRYHKGEMRISMTELCGASYYHGADGALDGGTYEIPGGSSITHVHPEDTFPYVFMTSTVNGSEVLLASKLIFTEGESTQSIGFTADSWMLIDLSFKQDIDGGPGSGYIVTINGSFLSEAEFEEAMNNCEGVFIRSEYGASGVVGDVDEYDYLTQISEIGFYEIPEPATVALLMGFASLGLVFIGKTRNKKIL